MKPGNEKGNMKRIINILVTLAGCGKRRLAGPIADICPVTDSQAFCFQRSVVAMGGHLSAIRFSKLFFSILLGLAPGLAYAQPAVSSVLNAASYDAVVAP